jgi:hypothetical protein
MIMDQMAEAAHEALPDQEAVSAVDADIEEDYRTQLY